MRCHQKIAEWSVLHEYNILGKFDSNFCLISQCRVHMDQLVGRRCRAGRDGIWSAGSSSAGDVLRPGGTSVDCRRRRSGGSGRRAHQLAWRKAAHASEGRIPGRSARSHLRRLQHVVDEQISLKQQLLSNLWVCCFSFSLYLVFFSKTKKDKKQKSKKQYLVCLCVCVCVCVLFSDGFLLCFAAHFVTPSHFRSSYICCVCVGGLNKIRGINTRTHTRTTPHARGNVDSLS